VENELVVQEEGMPLELSKADTYDSVAERLAEELKLEDPQFLRFTQHNAYTQSPKPSPLRFRQHETLVEMLSQFNNMSDIVYYEVLDMPLPELERLKVLRVRSRGRIPASSMDGILFEPFVLGTVVLTVL
jgi:ubiquitin carboxyl-terminal hydrolase 7